MIRVLSLAAALASALGCTAFHSVAAGPTPGEFYFSAQRSFLGIPGKPFIAHCQQSKAGSDIHVACDRLLTGRDAGSIRPALATHGDFVAQQEAPVLAEPTASPASRSAPASTAPQQPQASEAPDRTEATLLMIYESLARAYPSDRAQQRADYDAIAALIAQGFRTREIRDGIQDADARTEDRKTVADLATAVLNDAFPER